MRTCLSEDRQEKRRIESNILSLVQRSRPILRQLLVTLSIFCHWFSAEIADGGATDCPVISQANEGSFPFSIRERRVASLLFYLTNLHYRGGNNVFLRRSQVLSVSLYILTKEQTLFALSIISNTDSINNSVYSKSLSIYFHQIGYKPTNRRPLAIDFPRANQWRSFVGLPNGWSWEVHYAQTNAPAVFFPSGNEHRVPTQSKLCTSSWFPSCGPPTLLKAGPNR